MDKGVNFFEFSDPSENIQGVIQLEPEKKPNQPVPVQSAPTAPSSNLEKFRGLCDVDTETVFYRLKKTLWPFNRRKFLESKADLYGAFWVPTTLIFLLSVSGSMASTISDTEEFGFDPYAIITIAGVIYFFVFAVPAVLSFCLLAGLEITFTELLSLYGYSYFLFWPAAVISTFGFAWLRWLTFGISGTWAGILLTKNYYNDIEFLEGWKRYAAVGISLSGYVGVTLTANLYLYS